MYELYGVPVEVIPKVGQMSRSSGCDQPCLIIYVPSTSLRDMAPRNIDYSLYLVTDSTPSILGDKDLVSVVKDAVEGGT